MHKKDMVVGAEVVIVPPIVHPLQMNASQQIQLIHAGTIGKITEIISNWGTPYALISNVPGEILWPANYLELVSQNSVTKKLKYQENPTCVECGIPNNYAEVLVGEKYTCRACVIRRSSY